MKKSTSLFILLLLSLVSTMFSQVDTVYITHRNHFENGAWNTDTLHYPSNESGQFLYGTTVLPSARRMEAANYGYWLAEVVKLPCSGESMESAPETNAPVVHFTDSTMTIDFTITDNCCFDFLCEIDVSEEGDMRLYTTGYGGFCACYCCFGLQYKIILDLERIPIRSLYQGENELPLLVFGQ